MVSVCAPVADSSATRSPGSAPRCFISGNSAGATAAMSAALEPEMPETRYIAPTSTYDRPPRIWPSSAGQEIHHRPRHAGHLDQQAEKHEQRHCQQDQVRHALVDPRRRTAASARRSSAPCRRTCPRRTRWRSARRRARRRPPARRRTGQGSDCRGFRATGPASGAPSAVAAANPISASAHPDRECAEQPDGSDDDHQAEAGTAAAWVSQALETPRPGISIREHLQHVFDRRLGSPPPGTSGRAAAANASRPRRGPAWRGRQRRHAHVLATVQCDGGADHTEPEEHRLRPVRRSRSAGAET